MALEVKTLLVSCDEYIVIKNEDGLRIQIALPYDTSKLHDIFEVLQETDLQLIKTEFIEGYTIFKFN